MLNPEYVISPGMLAQKARMFFEAAPDEETLNNLLAKFPDIISLTQSPELLEEFIEAAPNEEAKKQMLISPDKYGFFPIRNTNIETSKVFLKAAPDEDTLKTLIKQFAANTPRVCGPLSPKLANVFLEAAPDEESYNEILESLN